MICYAACATLQLRPRVFDDLGLKPALEWQTKLFQKQTGIAVDLELSLPNSRFSSDIETTVFRMVQEALTNVARHSGATAAVVIVTADDTALQVEISDRGRGFDARVALARHDSLGLAGVAERVRLAGVISSSCRPRVGAHVCTPSFPSRQRDYRHHCRRP